MPQPLLSRSISALELEVGTVLLDRTRRKVRLTKAGEILLHEAREILSRTAFAKTLARRVGENEAVLRIGFVPSIAFGLLPSAVRRFRSSSPEVRLVLSERSPAIAVKELKSGSLDLALLHERADADEDIASETIVRSPFDVVVPSDWDLAKKKSVHLRDLVHLPFVTVPRASSPLQDLILAACRAKGFSPRVVHEVEETLALLVLVASGMGITFAHRLVKSIGFPGAIFVPVIDFQGALMVDLMSAWNTHAESDLLQGFRSALRETGSRLRQ